MENTTFEDFLQDKHASQYQGLDDEMGEDYEEWLSELDPDIIIAYANVYGAQRHLDGFKEASDFALKCI